MLRFRRRPPERAARWHENNPLEGTLRAPARAASSAFLLYLTFTAEHQVDTVANREQPALTVDVTGSKWEWTFIYPAYGFSVRSGTVGRQPLVVPDGRGGALQPHLRRRDPLVLDPRASLQARR